MGMNFNLPSGYSSVGEPVRDDLEVHSPECCGWLQVSGLGGQLAGSICKKAAEQLDLLIEEGVVPTDLWSKVREKTAHFPLYCVINENQMGGGVGKALEDRGFQPMGQPWKNPNTEKLCFPFIRYPASVLPDSEETS